MGKQIAGCGGLKRCQSDLLRRCLTPPPRPSSHPSGSSTMYTEARLLPGGSQPLVSMMGALGKPHSCLIGHLSNRRLASGLSHWSVQNLEWCHTHGDILIWGSPSLLLLLPCILHSISPNTDLAHLISSWSHLSEDLNEHTVEC